MPLVRIDLHQGHAEEELAAIGDVVHRAMVDTIAVPADDRFQVISQPGGRLVYDPQDLGVSRDHGIVTIQVTQVTQVTLACRRPVAKNETLLPADRGAARRMTGVEPRNVFVAWWRSGGRTGRSGKVSHSTPWPIGPRLARESLPPNSTDHR